MTLIQTNHARVRQAQRNLTNDDIEFVLTYGRRIYSRGALHIFLGRRDIPRDRTIAQRYGRLEGTVLVIGTDAEEFVLVTAYRNRRALRMLRMAQCG